MTRAPPDAQRLWRALYPVRVVRNHNRLAASAVAGTVLFVLLPPEWRLNTRLLITWNAAVALYLVLVAILLARFEVNTVRSRAAHQDEGAGLILLITVSAAVVSLGAIVDELGIASRIGGRAALGYLMLAALTIVQSWFLIQVIFALHYAHDFYGERGGPLKGLAFPHDAAPDYWDFVYFAFVLGMTCQVSDVQVTSKRMRRIVIAHGIVAFFFNLAILALAVNLGSGLLAARP